MNTAVVTSNVNRASSPPMGILSFQDEVRSIIGPQNIPRPDNDRATMKILPKLVNSAGQISPKPTLKEKFGFVR